MKTLTLAALVVAAGVCSAHADSRSESHAILTTVSKWGMCLVARQGEPSAKAQVYSVVGQIDAAFQRKHGVKATDIARERFGDNFVNQYYTMAKADYAASPSTDAQCTRLGTQVIGYTK